MTPKHRYDVFRQAAGETGLEAAAINDLLDKLRYWHNPQSLEQFGYNHAPIIQGMKDTIAGFPDDLQTIAARVLYYPWHMDGDVVFLSNPEFARTLLKAMQEAFAEHLEGGTHVVTYEHWLQGSNIDRPHLAGRVYVLATMTFETFTLSQDEYQRIREAKEHAAERHVRHFYGILHNRLDRRLYGELTINAKGALERIGGASDPLALLEDEYDRLNEDLQAYGRKIGYLSRLLIGCLNIADTYRVVKRNEAWIEGTIQPRHINEIDPKLQPAYAVAAQRYKELLESKLVMYGSTKVKDPFSDIPAEAHEIVRRCLEDAFAPYADVVPAGSITRSMCRHAALRKILEVERMLADGLTFTADLEREAPNWQRLHEQFGMPHFAPNEGLQPAGRKEDAFTAYCMVKYLEWRTSPAKSTTALKPEATTKIWALYYHYLMKANLMPSLIGRKKELANLAKKHGLGKHSFYQTFSAIGKRADKNPLKLPILEKVIPRLADYPEALALAQKDLAELQKRTKENKVTAKGYPVTWGYPHHKAVNCAKKNSANECSRN